MEFESLIFDIDGTLWDSRALVAEGYNIQLCREGLDHLCTNAAVLKTLFGKTMTDIADALLAIVPVPERYALMERCMATQNIYLQEDPCDIAYEGVKETLAELAKKHRLFIVSNSNCGYPELCMSKMGVTDLFSGHLCFGDTGTHKGVTIQRLMEKHNITSACYIGDTQGDKDATDMAGLPFIFCTYGFGQVDSCWKSIDKLGDLLNL